MNQVISTVRAWIESVLGTYTPITYQAKQIVALDQGGSSTVSYNVIPAGLAGVDWAYIATAAILLCVIYSVFRLLGVLLQSISGGRRFY